MPWAPADGHTLMPAGCLAAKLIPKNGVTRPHQRRRHLFKQLTERPRDQRPLASFVPSRCACRSLHEFNIFGAQRGTFILLNQGCQQTFGHGTGITGSSIHYEGPKSQSAWARILLAPMISGNWYSIWAASASAGEASGATFVNDFPKQEMDSRPLPVKSKLPVSLANVLTFTFHSLAHFRTCVTGRNGTGRVSTSNVRRRAGRAARRAGERNIHTNEGLGHCGLDLVLVLVFLGLRHGGRSSGLCRNSSGWLCRRCIHHLISSNFRINLRWRGLRYDTHCRLRWMDSDTAAGTADSAGTHLDGSAGGASTTTCAMEGSLFAEVALPCTGSVASGRRLISRLRTCVLKDLHPSPSHAPCEATSLARTRVSLKTASQNHGGLCLYTRTTFEHRVSPLWCRRRRTRISHVWVSVAMISTTLLQLPVSKTVTDEGLSKHLVHHPMEAPHDGARTLQFSRRGDKSDNL